MKIEIVESRWLPYPVTQYINSLNYEITGYSTETNSALVVGKDAENEKQIEKFYEEGRIRSFLD